MNKCLKEMMVMDIYTYDHQVRPKMDLLKAKYEI
jgi:hypothetical protein